MQTGQRQETTLRKSILRASKSALVQFRALVVLIRCLFRFDLAANPSPHSLFRFHLVRNRMKLPCLRREVVISACWERPSGKHWKHRYPYFRLQVSQLMHLLASLPMLNYCTCFILIRSEERRVGKECTSWCRSRWSPYH